MHPQAVVGEEENEQDSQYTRVTHPGVRTLKRISPLLVLLVAPKKSCLKLVARLAGSPLPTLSLSIESALGEEKEENPNHKFWSQHQHSETIHE